MEGMRAHGYATFLCFNFKAKPREVSTASAAKLGRLAAPAAAGQRWPCALGAMCMSRPHRPCGPATCAPAWRETPHLAPVQTSSAPGGGRGDVGFWIRQVV